MTEAILKAELCKQARAVLRTYVIERHEDRYTHGIPDICVTGNKINSRWEAKYANPDFKTKGIQELTMLRLDTAGFARYVIYWEKDGEKRTYIVKPSEIGKAIIHWGVYVDGFDHMWVIQNIKEIHNDHN